MRPIHRVLAFALAFIVLVFPCCAKNPKAGTYFVDVNCDATIVIQLRNEGPTSTDVLIQRFFADGSLMDSINKTVAGSATAEVRLQVPAGDAGTSREARDVIVDGQQHRTTREWRRSWIRVIGESVTVSAASEFFIDNKLSEGSLNSQKPKSGRVKIDDAVSGGEYAFVNLSDRPVQVGLCQEAEWTGSCNPRISDPVAPLAMIVYPLGQGYIRLRSSANVGLYATSKLFFTTGSTKTFDSTSSVSFEPIK